MKSRATKEPVVHALGLRRYLYITAALTGAIIMIVQILGAKLLAPYVGTSHFVWTAQIAVTLVALASGYYVGGLLADYNPSPGTVYLGMMIAAFYLCLTAMIVEPVAFFCLRFRLATGALLASAFLFFLPLSLLAMVGPFFIRVITTHVSGLGGNVGRLSAISTFGSFVGTVLIGYVLIPLLRNSITLYLTAAVLFGLGLIYFAVWGRSKLTVAVLIVIGGGLVAALGIRQELNRKFLTVDELEFRNSDFGMLQVIQFKDSPRRLFLNDYLTQNTYDIDRRQSQSMFTYMLHALPRAYSPEVQDVLCIGMGVGIVPMLYAEEGARVDVVEINPDVVPIAEQYFNFKSDKVSLFIEDGRSYLNRCDRQYDAIVLDAFLGDSSPGHLFSREAFAAMRRVLRPEGTLVLNCFGDFDDGRDYFTASLYKTLRVVFPSVRIHNARHGGNVFFVASPHPEWRTFRLPDLNEVHPAAQEDVRRAFNRTVETNPARGRVLTDDYNPVEYYDAENRERFRRGLIEMVRRF